jgi:hypothetical protein
MSPQRLGSRNHSGVSATHVRYERTTARWSVSRFSFEFEHHVDEAMHGGPPRSRSASGQAAISRGSAFADGGWRRIHREKPKQWGR